MLFSLGSLRCQIVLAVVRYGGCLGKLLGRIMMPSPDLTRDSVSLFGLFQFLSSFSAKHLPQCRVSPPPAKVRDRDQGAPDRFLSLSKLEHSDILGRVGMDSWSLLLQVRGIKKEGDNEKLAGGTRCARMSEVRGRPSRLTTLQPCSRTLHQSEACPLLIGGRGKVTITGY